MKHKEALWLLTVSTKAMLPSQIFTFSTPRRDKSIRTHGRLCRALAALSDHHCCNHQTGEGLLVCNPTNHLPGPPSVAKRTGKLTLNVQLQTPILAHPTGFPLHDHYISWGEIYLSYTSLCICFVKTRKVWFSSL